jgi:hypothetical protein
VNTDFFFTVIGDWGQGTTPEAQIAALQNAADPQMILTVGDNTYYTLLTSQSEFDSRSLAYYASVFPRTFFFPTLGNHDFALTSVSSYTSLPYIKTLALPVNAPAQPERYYSFNSGQAHFTSIDTDSCCDATQTNWLQNDLASSTATWKFVFLHHTPYSCASGSASFGSNLSVRNAWGPLFEQYARPRLRPRLTRRAAPLRAAARPPAPPRPRAPACRRRRPPRPRSPAPIPTPTTSAT